MDPANQVQFPPTAVDNQWVLLLTSSIEQGNALHDSIHRGEGVNYSPTEAAAALSESFSVQAGEELPASLSPLVPDELTLNHQLTTAAQRNDVLFAVFVSDTAKSYLLAMDGRPTSRSAAVVLIDTHQHGGLGSLIATGSIPWILQVFEQQKLAAYGTLTFITFPL